MCDEKLKFHRSQSFLKKKSEEMGWEVKGKGRGSTINF